jgi:hypothetical protein
MKVTTLSAIRTSSLYPKKIFLVLISVRGWVDPRTVVRPEVLCQWKIPMTPSILVPYIFHYLLLLPTNAQLFHQSSRSYMFRHYRTILRELVINALPSYTNISNAALLSNALIISSLRMTDCVETCSSVIICEIMLYLLVIIKNC